MNIWLTVLVLLLFAEYVENYRSQWFGHGQPPNQLGSDQTILILFLVAKIDILSEKIEALKKNLLDRNKKRD